MKKYESYKPANLPWLDEVPSHWQMMRNKVFLTESKETVGDAASKYKLLSLTLNGIIPRDITSGKGKFPSDYSTYKIIRSGDIVFCLFDIDETPRTVGLSAIEGMLTGAYSIFHIANINPRFLYYYYTSLDNVKALKPLYTGLRKTISTDTFLDTKMPVPPRSEQDQIVRYLDWQVSKINKLILAKKKQIELLREREQKLIAQAVTHGINNTAKMRDSGVPWIGYMPSHWQVMRCKYLFIERDERSIDGSETHLSMSQKYGLIPDSELDERRMLSASYAGGKLCYENDLVLNRLKAHLGVFALAPQCGVISPDYTVLIPDTSKILPAFAETVLKSAKCRHELRIRVRGIIEGFWRLYTDDFFTIKLPLPDIDEQKVIMQYISALHDSTSVYETAIRKEIDRLQELRTRLISDVVTGQIDVRSIEIPEYESVEEDFDEESDDEIDGNPYLEEVSDELEME